MFKIKLKKRKNHLPTLRKRLKALEGEEVFIGYSKSQGFHDRSDYQYETKDPLTYPQLAAIMETGSRLWKDDSGFMWRYKSMAMNPIEKNVAIKMALERYLSNIHKKTPPITYKEVLETVGGEYVSIFRNSFGNKNILHRGLTPSTITYKQSIGTPSPSSPMVGFGSLKNALSYRINGVLITPP